MPKLSIIILSWNQKQVLSRCLHSLKPVVCSPDTETIIVDNGSTDNTAAFIRSSYPNIKLITNTQNRGVAAARNQGITAATGNLILLLDNDTVANPEAIEGMAKFLLSNPKAGVVACRLLNSDGSTQSSIKPYPGLKVKICNVLGIKLKASHFPTDSHGTIYPTYVIGACQMFRKSITDEIGLLDEKIFYGPEDADFCLRVAKAGYQVCYLPQFSIEHLHRRATTRRLLSPLARKHISALFYFYRKHNRWF